MAPYTVPLGPKYSQHHKTQTVKARELEIWENVHFTSCVMCHMSSVTFHLSPVMCHLSPVTCQKRFKVFFTFKKFKVYFFLFILQRILTKWGSYSVEGLLSTGHTPSSFKCNKVLIVFVFFKSCIRKTKHLSTDDNSSTNTKTFC